MKVPHCQSIIPRCAISGDSSTEPYSPTSMQGTSEATAKSLAWRAACICLIQAATANAATNPKTITIKVKPGDTTTYTSVTIYKNNGGMTISAPPCVVAGPAAGSTGTWQLTGCNLAAATPLTITFNNPSGSVNYRIGGYDYTDRNGRNAKRGKCNDPIAVSVIQAGPGGTTYLGYHIPPNQYGYFYQMFPNPTNSSTVMQARIYLGPSSGAYNFQVLNNSFRSTSSLGFDLDDLEVPLRDPPNGYIYEVVPYMEENDATFIPGIPTIWTFNNATHVATMDFAGAGGLAMGQTGSIVAYTSPNPSTMILDNVNVDYLNGIDPPCTGTFVNEALVPSSPSCACNADVNNVGGVTFQDIAIVDACANHGNCGGCINSCDVNCDGIVNQQDVDATSCRFQNQPPSVCCPSPPGACCLFAGGCVVEPLQACQGQGNFVGDGTLCQPDPCQPTQPPTDYWTTWTDGQPDRSYLDLVLQGGFFGPGSEPFDGRVQWAGRPLNPFSTGDADTAVQRPFDPIQQSDPIGTFGGVPIELVQLSLVSAEPITVNCNGVPTHWNVAAFLSPSVDPPQGTMTAQKTHPNGGTFDSTLFVQPLLTFSRPAPPSVQLLDTGEAVSNRYLSLLAAKKPCGSEGGPTCSTTTDQLDCFNTDCCPEVSDCVPCCTRTTGGSVAGCTGSCRQLAASQQARGESGVISFQAFAMRVKLDSLQHPDPPNLPQFPPHDFSAFEGQVRWVALANGTGRCQETESPSTFFRCGVLQCMPSYRDWFGELNGAALRITGSEVIPSSHYTLQAISLDADVAVEASYGPALALTTQRWGDVRAPFQQLSPAPLTQPNITDIGAIVDKFKGLPGAPIVAQADLGPAMPNLSVNIADIANDIDAFKAFAYPFSIVQNCPALPRCDGPATVELDTGTSGMPPFQMQATGSPWVHNPNPNLGVILPPNAHFIPGIQETVPGDPTSQQVRVVIETSPDLQHSVCLPVAKKGCAPGLDYFETMPCNGEQSMTTEFVNTPIPAGFFDPGSMPFGDDFPLVGVPMGGAFGNTDTIIQRNLSLNFGTVPSTDRAPIEIVALSLRSAAPITVSYSNGNPNEQWNVAVGLSTVAPPPGEIVATKRHRNGGDFTARFYVQPRFTFTKVTDPLQVRVLDTGEQGLPPLALGNSDPNIPPDDCFKPMPWVQSLAPGSPVIAGSSCFVPGVKEDPPTQTQCCQRNCDEALSPGAFGSSHCTSPVNCDPVLCP